MKRKATPGNLEYALEGDCNPDLQLKLLKLLYTGSIDLTLKEAEQIAEWLRIMDVSFTSGSIYFEKPSEATRPAPAAESAQETLSSSVEGTSAHMCENQINDSNQENSYESDVGAMRSIEEDGVNLPDCSMGNKDRNQGPAENDDTAIHDMNPIHEPNQDLRSGPDLGAEVSMDGIETNRPDSSADEMVSSQERVNDDGIVETANSNDDSASESDGISDDAEWLQVSKQNLKDKKKGSRWVKAKRIPCLQDKCPKKPIKGQLGQHSGVHLRKRQRCPNCDRFFKDLASHKLKCNGSNDAMQQASSSNQASNPNSSSEQLNEYSGTSSSSSIDQVSHHGASSDEIDQGMRTESSSNQVTGWRKVGKVYYCGFDDCNYHTTNKSHLTPHFLAKHPKKRYRCRCMKVHKLYSENIGEHVITWCREADNVNQAQEMFICYFCQDSIPNKPTKIGDHMIQHHSIELESDN